MRDDEAEASTIVHPGGSTAFDRASSAGIDDLDPGNMMGRYELVERLGAGGMGVVWSALDPQLERRVAIKLVHPRLARSTDASGRLLREARAMAKLSHRNVVTVHDAGEVDGRLFVAMELVPGTTLGAMLRGRDGGSIADWKRWLALMLDAGRGLAAAHGAGLLHRDFKPDNVLVDTAGRVCVGDFGLATLNDETFAAAATQQWKADEVELTTTGALLGTPAYMSPQQLRGESVDARADQFSFCVAAFEALYGTRPFVVPQTGLDALPALADAIEAQVLPEPAAAGSIPTAVRDVLRRGLAATPDARWPDMDTLLGELERAAGLDRRRAASLVGLPAPRRRAIWPIVAGGVVALAIAAVVVWALRGDSRGTVTTKRLFELSMHSRITLSSDGRLLAIGSDRLEVRDLDGTLFETAPLASETDVYHLELDGPELRFAVDHSRDLRVWRYREGPTAIRTDATNLVGRWFGRSAFGDVLVTRETFSINAGGRIVRTWPVPTHVEVLVIAPDRKRAAYLETSRFDGHVVVVDLATGTEIARSERQAGLTALAWRDDHRLVFATGTFVTPAIFEVDVTATALGAPRKIFGLDAGWFAVLAASPHRIAYVDGHPSTRARIVEVPKLGDDPTAPAVTDYDRSTVATTLGWATDDEFLAWSRRTKLVEVHSLDRKNMRKTMRPTPIALDGEPVNATQADGILIVAVRRPASRDVLAYSLTTGEPLWRHDKTTFAVRCAADRHPPCFAIAGNDELFPIDPKTGVLGPKPLHTTGRLEDIAVSADGARILLGGRGSIMIELARDGTQLREIRTDMAPVRSVAYHGDDLVFAGTTARSSYELRFWPAGSERPSTLMKAVDDILSLARPSADGKRVLVLARSFAPDLWQLDD